MKTLLSVLFIALTIIFSLDSKAGTIGYAAGHPEDRDIAKFIPFIEYLNNEVGEEHTVVFDTHSNISSRFLKGEFNIAILSPLNYLETKRMDSYNKLKIIGKVKKNEKEYYESSLVINNKYNGGRLDLSSFKFLYPSTSSTSSYLYPLSMLKEIGVDTKNLSMEKVHESKYEILKRISLGERAVAGASQATLDAAKRKGIKTSNLFLIDRTPREIPYDAIVVYNDNVGVHGAFPLNYIQARLGVELQK